MKSEVCSYLMCFGAMVYQADRVVGDIPDYLSSKMGHRRMERRSFALYLQDDQTWQPLNPNAWPTENVDGNYACRLAIETKLLVPDLGEVASRAIGIGLLDVLG